MDRWQRQDCTKLSNVSAVETSMGSDPLCGVVPLTSTIPREAEDPIAGLCGLGRTF